MKHTDTQPAAGLLSAAYSPIPPGALYPAELLTELIKGVFMLDPELRDVVGLRFLGATYREIGEQLGISTQLAEMRHKRALRDWPALRPLFPEKVAKRSRRKGRA
ncbi:hypothetical protein PDESU_05227 [Pontiella desulfatans]|uniref:RNA polymerase sigma-70 region 4 domain-containing protein n=1 Tax=Pontiella desulfatans TaxID=2750659 RepID=A0A6C2UBH3_PONDE|nr:sigma factor-like helix-turn-helix DNA-binding protein [Pontiella desulfatans]VGO16636.1 hypothetical protein PDESU_05227 [Pontiella desulfatans]